MLAAPAAAAAAGTSGERHVGVVHDFLIFNLKALSSAARAKSVRARNTQVYLFRVRTCRLSRVLSPRPARPAAVACSRLYTRS